MEIHRSAWARWLFESGEPLQVLPFEIQRPQSNRTERVNRDPLQMIASFINDNHETWDQFLREFTYALRTAVHGTTGKTSSELFLGRKLTTSFQKLVLVSDGAEFTVVNYWVLLEKHPKNSTTKKVVKKFKPKFEATYRVLRVQNNNLVICKAGKRTTVNIDQVRIPHQRKSDEKVIVARSSDSTGLDYQSSCFQEDRHRIDQLQSFRISESGGQRGEQEK
ncbi:uncharacterized protein TNCV_2636131 [Trichonephila clavipes]|nr:uncharacterized protein TNCV_2636131 [Trichonephila clavipes]